MYNTIVGKKYLAKFNLLFSLLICGTLLVVTVNSTYAVTQTQITSGLSAAVGVALDESNNHLYFVEYNAPNLKRIVLTPECEDDIGIPCVIETIPITPGFSHAEDVQLDIEHGFAYITTRDDPGTGGLWKVDLATGAKTLVTFNLGGPQQLVLDLPHNRAYTVGYNDGRIRSIDLITGVKVPLFMDLDHPVGLAITNDGQYAYVSEQAATGGRISKIDLVMGIRVEDVVTGLTAPFFLAWTDNLENALYVVERDPANKVTRVDLITSTKNDAVTGLPWRPSGIALRSGGNPAYVTTDSTIQKVNLIDFNLTEPVFTTVGHVPSTSIIDGYATTDPGYFFQVKHAPFGGTVNIFGNLPHFKDLGATHYEVEVSKDGGPFEALSFGWTAYKWNPDPAIAKYEPTAVAPETGTTKYKIPDEYPLHAAWWVPPFLMMRWPSGENGTYEFRVNLYQKSGATYNDMPGALPTGNSLILEIDNTLPQVKISRICQQVATPVPGDDPCYPKKEVKTCDIVSSPNNNYTFEITAYDPSQHLRYYRLKALWGENKQDVIADDYYSAHEDPVVPHVWSGVLNEKVPGGSWHAQCNCAHTFYLWAGKRTINGYNYIIGRGYHKSITINNAPDSCGLGPCGFTCP